MTRWQRFLCNVLDWHRVSEIEWHGTRAVYTCKRCKRRLLQDPHGNWFAIEEPKP
jgi:hypothetical protein